MKNIILLIAKNPETGKASILRVDRREDVASYNTIASCAETFPLLVVSHYTAGGVGVPDKCYLDLDSTQFDDLDSNTEWTLRCLGCRWCDECGAIVLPQDIRKANHYDYFGKTEKHRLCNNCYAKYLAERGESTTETITFASYHETSDDACVINGDGEDFTLNNVKGIGIEMEYGGDDAKRLDWLNHLEVSKDFANLCRGVFRFERDCTVVGEFISNVFTEKSFATFNWEAFTHGLKQLGNDESKPCVGFHVHLSKTWLGDTPKIQARNFVKFLMAFKTYEDDFKAISGRRLDEDANDFLYCSFADWDMLNFWKRKVEDLDDNASDNAAFWRFEVSHGSEGCACISSGKTVEVRIAHSTNDAEKIRHYVALLVGIMKACAVTTSRKIFCLNKLFRFVPKETVDYWHKKGAFLRTKAVDDKGFTLAA